MKVYISSLFFLLLSFFPFFTYAAGEHDYFEVILSKSEAQVGDALDLTIRAVDENGEIVTDYTGDILVFSESDPEAEFPNDLAENSYSFTLANEGEVKFENAVQFRNAGKQDLYVYDLLDDTILGVAEIDISPRSVESNVAIEILSPENGVTLARNTINVSGNTRKNHQIRVLLNGSQEMFTTSNDDGIFEKQVENLQDGENTLQAFVLNSDNEVIGESRAINVKISSTGPEFKRINITPTGAVYPETEINIEVISNTGLSEVKVIVNDIITMLEESRDGIYVGNILAPNNTGEFPIDVSLSNEFAIENYLRSVETLTVIDRPELNTAGEEEVVVVETITPVTSDSTVIPESLDLQITNIEVTELKERSIITWKALSDAESYNVYKKTGDNEITLIENVTSPRFEVEITGDVIRYEDFAIKALGKTQSGILVQGDLSEMTKVKTGPELYIALGLIALLLTGGIFLASRRRV